MNNLKILLKNNINILLGNIQGKKQRKSTTTAFILLMLGMAGIFALYFYQAYTMFDGLGRMGLGKLCVFHGIITALTVVVIIGVMRVTGETKHNDNDFLLSLPIKKRDIIISKTINKYIFDLFFVFLLFVPYVLLYQIFDTFTFRVSFMGLVVVLVLPLLSVGISYIFDFVITRLFNKFRLGNLFKSLISTFLFVLIMVMLLVKTFTYGTVQFATMEDYFADRPVSNLILKTLFDGSFLNILLFLLMTIVPFLIGLTLFGINFGKNFVGYANKNKEYKYKDGKSSFGSLFKKELNYYATTPAYIVNTIIGPVFMLVISILVASMGMDKIAGYFGATASTELFVAIIVITFMAMISMTYITSCSISLEGKQIWLLKSSPINEKTLFLVKAVLNIVLVMPFLLFSTILLTIFMNLSFVQFLAILIIPTLMTLLISFGGLLINLWVPRLDWDDPTKVVKSSMSVLFTMIYGFVMSFIPVLFYLLTNMSFTAIALVSSGIYVIVLVVIIVTLFTYGVKMFRKL